MADYAISSADLSGISRSLNTINNNITIFNMNTSLNGLKNGDDQNARASNRRSFKTYYTK